MGHSIPMSIVCKFSPGAEWKSQTVRYPNQWYNRNLLLLYFLGSSPLLLVSAWTPCQLQPFFFFFSLVLYYWRYLIFWGLVVYHVCGKLSVQTVFFDRLARYWSFLRIWFSAHLHIGSTWFRAFKHVQVPFSLQLPWF